MFSIQKEIIITSLFRKLTKVATNHFKTDINRFSDPLEMCKILFLHKSLSTNQLQSPKNPLVCSYLRVQNGQGRVIFLTRSSGRTSDNQKSDFTKYSFFLPNGESGKLKKFSRPNEILLDQKCDKVTQQHAINFIFQDTF